MLREPAATPEILEARTKFLNEPGAPDSLTLEDIMRVYYNKPCRRIAPNCREAGKYARGSVLVKENEIVLVLNPKDESTFLPRKSSRVVGCPIKCFKGLLPGSRFYTRGGVYVVMESKEVAAELRMTFGFFNKLREHSRVQIAKMGPPKGETSFFAENEAGKLNDHRCREAWTLSGHLEGMRLRKVFAPVE